MYVNLATGRYVTASEAAGRRDVDTPDLAPYDPERYVTVTSGRSLVATLAGKDRQRVKLSSCPVGCRGVEVAGTLVTWSEGDLAVAYDLRQNRRRTWRFQAAKLAPAIRVVVVPTIRGAMIAVPTKRTDASSARYVVYSASFSP